MSDAPAGFPPGWPTEEHRSRVATRAHALRNRRLAARATTVALALVLLAGGFAVFRGGGSGVKVATTPPGAATAIPKGWRVVDFGEARFGLPQDWHVTGPGTVANLCPTSIREGIVLFDSQGLGCSTIVVEPMTTAVIRSLRQTVADKLVRYPVSTIHGFTMYLVYEAGFSVRYAVPELRVFLTVRRGVVDAQPVLDTLGPSARRVVLASGPGPAVPDNWRTVEYGGIKFRVPPTMPVTRLGVDDTPPGAGCSVQTFSQPEVVLGSGMRGPLGCSPGLLAGKVPVPTDGVWISTVQTTNSDYPEPRFVHLPPKLFQLDSTPDPLLVVRSILVKDSRVGYPDGTVVRIGLGADPTIARIILFSIEPTAN